MDFQQIKYFLTVAQCLNFTVAASKLHISQSTLSRQITAMEKEWNLLLFMRNNRNVALTQCGAYLNVELGKMYTQYMQITEHAKEIFGGIEGKLSIGVLEEVTLDGKMQEALYKYQECYPNHAIEMQRGSFKKLSDGLLNGAFDFIITFLFDISEMTSLKYKVLEKVQDGILISTKHPLSKKTYFYPKDFKEETFLILSREDSIFASSGAIDCCTKNGFYPKSKMAPDLDTAMLWVEAGMGLAFSYSNSVAAHNPSMTFVPFPEEIHIQESLLVLAWNENNRNPAIEYFQKNL